MTCQNCKKNDLRLFLSLGHQPPSDAFLRPEDLQKPEITYPLDVYFCPSCTLVQLGYSVDPDILFRDYVYMTGTNRRLVESFKGLVERAIPAYGLGSGDLAIDIGSNDGTLLKNYLPHGIKILGIDPSSVAKTAAENGVPTINDYFNSTTAAQALKDFGKAKVITATNVFAHVRQLDSFMEGVDTLLNEKGVFVTESGYVLDIIEKMEYDCIYHEHLRYYSLRSIDAILERFGMEAVRVERTIGSSGGSIRVFSARKGVYTIDESVKELRLLEDQKELNNFAAYERFAARVALTKRNLLEIVHGLRKKGERIVGIGAPAKGNTLLNYCKLDSDAIEYLVETNPIKIGRYSPGMHLPVINESQLFSDQPEAALLLAWNYADIIAPKLRGLGYQGKFIVPNPVPKIV